MFFENAFLRLKLRIFKKRIPKVFQNWGKLANVIQNAYRRVIEGKCIFNKIGGWKMENIPLVTRYLVT